MKFKVLSFLFSALLFTGVFKTQATDLSAGDIAVVGFNFDNPDEFALLVLAEIPAGTEIKVTDNGWQSDSQFRPNEGIMSWTPGQNIPAGTIINSSEFSSAGGSFAFSGSGDQIFVYTGEDSNPTFLFGLNSEGAGVWQTGEIDSNKSNLPNGLTNGTTAIALNEIDNAIYNMSVTTGDKATILAAICNTTNWSGSNSVRQTMPTSTTPAQGADLQISIESSNSTPDLNSDFNLTITVTNNGSDEATGVETTSLLPAGLNYVSDNAGGQYTQADGKWIIGTLAKDATTSFIITAQASTTNQITVNAQITASDQQDGDNANNTASVNITAQDGTQPQGPAAGDIAVVGFNFDNPDEFALLVLAEIPVGTEIKVTDNGWQSDDQFRANEGIMSWTPDQNIPAGTIINSSEFSSAGGSFAFSSSGDQILVYTGEDSNPNFLFALNSEGAGVWQTGDINANKSTLPNGLTNGTTAIALNEIDNAVYNMSVTTSDKATVLTAICNSANWSGSNSDRQIMPTSEQPAQGADLLVDISVDDSTPKLNDQIEITITVTNNGPEDATNVTLTTLLPNEINYNNDNSGGSYNETSGLWNIGDIANGSASAIVIIAEIVAESNFSIEASLNNTTEDDPNTANNSSSIFLNSMAQNIDGVPAGYYSSAMGLSGEELKNELHNIISNHTVISYSDARDAMKIIDEDPVNQGKVRLFYTGWLDDVADFGGGVSQWNREHVWPKSHGTFDEDDAPGSDLHNLRPTDVSVNNKRGNLDFDNGGAEFIDGDGATGCFFDNDSWEPRDEVKGDVARVLFYMATRYEAADGWDLELTSSIPTSAPLLGKLEMLLQWNQNDPVDENELNRNNAIYSQYQHNRNPFIDHPEYISYIWGNKTAPESLILENVEFHGTHIFLVFNREVTSLGEIMQYLISYNPIFNPVSVSHGATNNVIDLQLPNEIPIGANVQITYSHSPLSPIMTQDDAIVNSFSVSTPVVEPLELVSVDIFGDEVYLEFSHDILEYANKTQFSASYNPTLTPVAIKKGKDNKTLVLNFGQVIPKGANTTISYTHNSNSPLKSTNGATMSSFSVTSKANDSIQAVPISDYSVLLSFVLIAIIGVFAYKRFK